MRKILVVLFLAVVSSCSQEPQDKPKRLIAEWIKANANDPDSYEPGEYSGLDTAFQKYDDNGGLIIQAELISLETSKVSQEASLSDWQGMSHTSVYDPVEVAKLKQNIESLSKQIDSLKVVYEKEKSGYDEKSNYRLFMTHSFRAKNVMGALVLQNYYFEFDKNLTQIIEAKLLK
jgi:hypothetical protein